MERRRRLNEHHHPVSWTASTIHNQPNTEPWSRARVKGWKMNSLQSADTIVGMTAAQFAILCWPSPAQAAHTRSGYLTRVRGRLSRPSQWVSRPLSWRVFRMVCFEECQIQMCGPYLSRRRGILSSISQFSNALSLSVNHFTSPVAAVRQFGSNSRALESKLEWPFLSQRKHLWLLPTSHL